MKRTISAMRGPGSLNHNRRSFTAENVDPERSSLNVVYRDEPIQKVYHELFDEAVNRYNAKQKRKDRCINDYYEHLRTGKQEKLFHELIVQIGNKDDMGVLTENGALAKELLDEYMQGFQERNPTLRVFGAFLHMDEATPHLHIDFVPYVSGWKGKGLDTKVSERLIRRVPDGRNAFAGLSCSHTLRHLLLVATTHTTTRRTKLLLLQMFL